MTYNLSLKDWQLSTKDATEMIRSCSTVHCVDGMNSMTIGMCPKIWRVPDSDLCSPSPPVECRSILLYTNISPSTDTRVKKPIGQSRAEICNTLSQKGFAILNHKSADGYWADLKQSIFVVSPEGNGVDCHRTYEALWAGAIPIVQSAHRSHIENVYGNVPLLWTDDYSELTEEYLRAQLERFHSVMFDFSRLHFSQLSAKEKSMCRFRTQIWKDVTDCGKSLPNQWPVHEDHFKLRLQSMRKHK